MRKFSKLLMLVLVLALLVGAVFAVTSSAANDPTAEVTLTGVTRTHQDFTGTSYAYHAVVDGAEAATPTTSAGSLPTGLNSGVKYGHIRTLTAPDGNVYFDWTFHKDYTTNTNHDSFLSVTGSGHSIKGNSYYVAEFDMATRTDFPGNMSILTETRIFNEANSGEASGGPRIRTVSAKYNATSGTWAAGGNQITVEPGQWVHVTLVTKLVPTPSTNAEGAAVVNYGASVTKLYINGEYVSSVAPFDSTDMAAETNPRIHYLGIGYSYGTGHNGTLAEDSIAIDNVTYTKFADAYAADPETDKLAPLFAAENPVTTVTDLGEEIIYTSDYKLPGKIGIAAYVPEEGDEYIAGDFAGALQLLKEDENEGATIKLYGNHYNPIVIDYPVEVDLNGFELQNGWDVAPHLIVEYDAEAGILSVYEDLDQSLTLEYYDVPFTDIDAPVFTEVYATGREVVLNTSALAPEILVDGKVGRGPTGVYKVYDESGVEVTPTTVGENEAGKTYYVCPIYNDVTLENDITFYVSVGGAVTFYDSTDLLAAATDGDMPANATIVLIQDCVYSTSLYIPANSSLYVDLNGNKLASKDGANIVLARPKSNAHTNIDYYFYSSKDGAVIDCANNTLLNSFGYDVAYCATYFFGYKDAATKAAGRMTINCGTRIGYLNKRDLDGLRFYNCEIHVRNASGGLFALAQTRMTYPVEFDTCDVYTGANLVHAQANGTNCDLTIKNSNIYGGGAEMFPAAGGTASGGRTVTLINSKIYNFELGYTDVSKTPVNLRMDETSMLSCEPTTLKNTVAGKTVHCSIPETVTIDGVVYITGYQWLPENTAYATFNYYGIAKDDVTADTPVQKTVKVAVGSWWANLLAPGATGKFYDPTIDPNFAFVTEMQDVVYDAEGNVVNKTALEDADAGKTFNVYVDTVVTDEKVALNVYAYVKLANDTYLALENEDISAALREAINSTVLPEGSTLVLLKDVYYSGPFYFVNSKIDLNGKTFYVKVKQNSFELQTGVSGFIYSSAPGARFMQGPTNPANAGDCGYVASLYSANAHFYLGYQDAETLSPHRIAVYCGAFAQVTGDTDVHLGMLDVYKVCGDNFGFLNYRSGSSADGNLYIDNCNFYGAYGSFITFRDPSAMGVAYISNTNIYGSSGSFVGYNGGKTYNVTGMTINLENVGIYGSLAFNGSPDILTDLVVNVKGTLKTCFALTDEFVLEDGKVALPLAGIVAKDGITVPASGVYGAEEKPTFNGEYAYAYEVVEKPAFDENAYKAQAFQNMTLSTNVIGNLYIPVDVKAVVSVTLNGVDILDKELVEVIGGNNYYVLSFGVAPKYGNRSLTLVVNFDDGNTASFEMSVANYAKALLGIAAGDNAYIADSQEMMKYILNYIKEVAVEFGGADAETIFADLGDIAVNADVTVGEEVKDTTAVQNYVTHAALNLDAYAGFAFKVAQGFVGEIKIELAGVAPVEAAYTADAPAGENEVIVLENVPARLFRGDVTITVTPAEGEAVSAEYNLATYVSASEEAYAKAFYAYTVKAEEYYGKYPTVGTVD